MMVGNYVGKTLEEIAKETHIFWYPVRVFLLKDKQDNTGKLLVSAYSVAEAVGKYPDIACAVVEHADSYYGETILRVLAPQNIGVSGTTRRRWQRRENSNEAVAG